MKAKFTAPEEKPDVPDELFDKPAPEEAKAKTPDRAALANRRDDAQRAHAAATRVQAIAEIDADVAARTFSTRFTELMSSAPRTDEEVEAAYKLAQEAFSIVEDKARLSEQARTASREALLDYLLAYYGALVAERKTT